MMIPINDQLRINSDSRQWMIERKRIRKGKESWEARLYFGTLEACLKDLGELMVRTSKANTLADALKAVENVATTLSQALTPQIDEVLEAIGREGTE